MTARTDAPSGPSPALDERGRDFIAEAMRAIETGSFEALVLSKSRSGKGDVKTVRIRPIDLRGMASVSLVSATSRGDTTRNVAVEHAPDELARLLGPGSDPSFAHATLRTTAGVVQAMVDRNGRTTIRRHASLANEGPAADGGIEPVATAALSRAHDRERERMLPLDLPCWMELGIVDAQGRPVPAMARKWRQIDRFLTVIDKAVGPLAPHGDRRLRVVDYGCGKGYLTFAVHEYLRRRFGRAPIVVGVELREELVEFGNAAARRVGAEGLEFVQGELASVAPGEADVVIALHACDTATDHAIDLGIAAGARLLVCSPCCHREVRPQMRAPRPARGLLRHGIHLGQEAEMVTDALRALYLEASGYDAQVFEFVALEHTRKNKMILASRGERSNPAAVREAIGAAADLKAHYGIREQCLETLLRRRGLLPPIVADQACQTP